MKTKSVWVKFNGKQFYFQFNTEQTTREQFIEVVMYVLARHQQLCYVSFEEICDMWYTAITPKE